MSNEETKQIATSAEFVEEFRQRLLEVHGITLDKKVTSILLKELSGTIRMMIDSRSVDGVRLPGVGTLYLHKKPSRKLHCNLPHIKAKYMELPERYELRFNPSEDFSDSISNY